VTNSSEIDQIVEAHTKVGQTKPVSYLPINTIESVLKLTIDRYESLIRETGAECAIFSESETCIRSGAVFAFDPTALMSVLQANRELLAEHGWPQTPAVFISKIAAQWVDEGHPLISVIRRAFGDFALSIKGVVIHDNHVLLLRNQRGEWELPGGRPESGEDHQGALEREIREETGLDIEVGALVDEHPFEVLPGRLVQIVAYACTLAGASAVTLSHEHVDMRWVPLAELGETIAGSVLPAGYLGAIRQAISQPRSPNDRVV
jgi:8-oxo-dGTP pyrophosphatase MutT (NUDIX family)